MMKKSRFWILTFMMCCFFGYAGLAHAGKYDKKLSSSERDTICSKLEKSSKKQTEVPQVNTILPESVFENIYTATRDIYSSVAVVSILGDALMCHAVHGDRDEIKFAGVTIFDYPNISVFLCGFGIFVFGFMLLFAVAFYIVDISFKLGLAAVLLPIGVALWPFAWTRDKLTKLISIILKSAAIFAFLAVTVTYAVNMMLVALGGLDNIFEAIEKNDTDFISEHFTLFSLHFLVVVAAFIYAFKLIGATITDYVDKLFPDNVFGGGKGSQPMHMLATQATDFVKKKVAAPVVSFGHDVLSKKAGQVTTGVGKLITGDYDRKIGRAFRNPDETLDKIGLNLEHRASRLAGGFKKTLNNLGYGARIIGANFQRDKLARHDAKEALRMDRNAQNAAINEQVSQDYNQRRAQIDERIEANEQAHQAKVEEREANRSEFGKAVRKFAKTVLHVTRAVPGSIIKGAGYSMQDNRQNTSAANRAAEAEEALKREKEESAQQKREDWK